MLVQRWACQNHVIFSARPTAGSDMRSIHQIGGSQPSRSGAAGSGGGVAASTWSSAAARPPAFSASTCPGAGPKVARRRRWAIAARSSAMRSMYRREPAIFCTRLGKSFRSASNCPVTAVAVIAWRRVHRRLRAPAPRHRPAGDRASGSTRSTPSSTSAARARARYLLARLMERAREQGVGVPAMVTTDYINTIPPEQEPWFPGDEVARAPHPRVHPLERDGDGRPRRTTASTASAATSRRSRRRPRSTTSASTTSSAARATAAPATRSSSRATPRRASTPARSSRAA